MTSRDDDDGNIVDEVLDRIVEISSSEKDFSITNIKEIAQICIPQSVPDKCNELNGTSMDIDTHQNGIDHIDDDQRENGTSSDNAAKELAVENDDEIEPARNDDKNKADDTNDDRSLLKIRDRATNGGFQSLSFLFEEEYNDDVDSITSRDSNIDLMKRVVPSSYTRENINNRNESNDQRVDDEEPDYLVEKILDKKLDQHGRAVYLVKWEGYPSSANTWEPIQNLVDCDKKMEEFELAGALKLAKKLKTVETTSDVANGGKNGKSTETKKKTNSRSRKHRQFQVMDVMGMTYHNDERYYLVSIANSTQKTFIRGSLAKRVFPSKIIDFYVKNLKWKQKADTEPK